MRYFGLAVLIAISSGTLAESSETILEKRPICTAETEGMIVQASLVEARDDARFAGRVVQRTSDGTLHPIQGAHFYQVEYRFLLSAGNQGSDSAQSPVSLLDVTTRADGSFSDDQRWAHSISTEVCFSGIVVERKIPVTGVYLVRAESCDELRLVFDLTWKPHDLVMTCSRAPSSDWSVPNHHTVHLKMLPKIGDTLANFRSSQFSVLASSAQVWPAHFAVVNGIEYTIGVDEKHRVKFVSTNDRAFVSPEGFHIGDSSATVVKSYTSEAISVELGWGKYIQLQSGWSAMLGSPFDMDLDLPSQCKAQSSSLGGITMFFKR